MLSQLSYRPCGIEGRSLAASVSVGPGFTPGGEPGLVGPAPRQTIESYPPMRSPMSDSSACVSLLGLALTAPNPAPNPTDPRLPVPASTPATPPSLLPL